MFLHNLNENMIEIDEIFEKLILKNKNENKRSMFMIYGPKCHEAVPTIVTLNKMNAKDNKVLWCFRNESAHIRRSRKHNRKQEKMKRDKEVAETNYDNFVMGHHVNWCHYGDINEVLGCTYDVVVMQDFEVMTPNTMAKVIETVRGGGLVVILMHDVARLSEIGQMSMDAHKRYKTSAYDFVHCRFNYRFLYSLLSHTSCIVSDDNYQIAPMTLASLNLELEDRSEEKTRQKIAKCIAKLGRKHPQTKELIELCVTKDQARSLVAVTQLLDAKGRAGMKTNFMTIKSGRGRGKSALLGLSIGFCLTTGRFSRICVTSPCQENIGTVMEFVVRSIEALGYVLNESYTSRGKDFIEVTNVRTQQRCYVKYVSSSNSDHPSLFGGFDVLCIDETAAIPLPVVRRLLGNSGASVVLMSSTIHGYEGTGRSLALKLFTEIQPGSSNSMDLEIGEVINLELSTPIRYSKGDQVEKWLDGMLCTNCEQSLPDVTNILEFVSGLTIAATLERDTKLLCVNRDTLFSGHPQSEKLLLSIMSIFVSSHYKNSPNDLQMLADSSSHQLFCLVHNKKSASRSMCPPIILAVVQVAMEGGVLDTVAEETVNKGLRPSGDMVAWTIAQQYNDVEFPRLRGLRIVRIAVHPHLQNKGIGSHCLRVLTDTLATLPENSDGKLEVPRKSQMETMVTNGGVDRTNDPLLSKFLRYPDVSSFGPVFVNMSEFPKMLTHMELDYISVSFGLTKELFRFWKRNKFSPVYLRQTKNEVTGEFSCIVVKALSNSTVAVHKQSKYNCEFSRRFSVLLSSAFSRLDVVLSLDMLVLNKVSVSMLAPITKQHLAAWLTVDTNDDDDHNCDLVRLDRYLRGLIDYHAIIDLVVKFASLYFNWTAPQNVNIKLPMIQRLVLLGLGLQHKTVDELVADLAVGTTRIAPTNNNLNKSESSFTLNSGQVLGHLRESLKTLLKCYKKILMETV